MLPREHGAYGQLLFPLVTALAVGRPRVVAWLLAASAIGAFMAHEPLLVLLGQRGARAAREQRLPAALWLGGSAGAATVCGVGAIALSGPDVRIALLLTAVLAAILVVFIVTRQEHTTGGEVLSALALSSLAWPVTVAGGANSRVGISCAAAFAAIFVAGTLSVRAVIANTRHPPAAAARGVAGLVAVASMAMLWSMAIAGRMSSSAPWSALPVCGGGLVLVLTPPSARHLRTIGWSLIGATTLTAVVLIAALR
jgi:hypothetical protein